MRKGVGLLLSALVLHLVLVQPNHPDAVTWRALILFPLELSVLLLALLLLAEGQAALAARGVAMRSGYLLSSTRGGQSWLAHGPVASGLRTKDQVR